MTDLSGPMPGPDGQPEWTYAPVPVDEFGHERCAWCGGRHTPDDHDMTTHRCLHQEPTGALRRLDYDTLVALGRATTDPKIRAAVTAELDRRLAD